MRRALVLADDLTGAAEIAGIAKRLGHTVNLLREAAGPLDADVTVIDTDSRSLPSDAAASRVDQLLDELDLPRGTLLFKKTDSVFRGPIAAEINALLRRLGLRAAALLAQNPSRGRTVRDGIYRIHDIPLDRTEFADDPTHPATTANVIRLLGEALPLSARSLPTDASIPTDLREPTPCLFVLDATCEDEVHRWAKAVPDSVLPAGGADFFTAWLATVAPTDPREAKSNDVRANNKRDDAGDGVGPQPPVETRPRRSLLVRGTATPLTEAQRHAMERRGFNWLAMPDDVFASTPTDAAPLRDWVRQLQVALDIHGSAAIHVDRPVDRSAGAARRIEQRLAEATAIVLADRSLDELLIEGGATASAICRRLGWNRFEVLSELAPGIVRLRPTVADPVNRPCRALPALTIKPGSYPWPDAA